MPPESLRKQRLADLESLLALEYRKLRDFEQELGETSYFPAKRELKNRIDAEIKPSIRAHEAEYAALLAEAADPAAIPAHEAQEALAELTQAVDRVQRAPAASRTDEQARKLDEILALLKEPDKAAAAKLKIALPIVPLLASYEMELDTENFLTQVYRRIKSLFGGRA